MLLTVVISGPKSGKYNSWLPEKSTKKIIVQKKYRFQLKNSLICLIDFGGITKIIILINFVCKVVRKNFNF